MAEFNSFSLREIGGKDRLEDFTLHEEIVTASGKTLDVILVCGGVGGGTSGEQAARLTGRTILDSLEVAEIANIPALLMNAVEEANRVVYSELRGAGSSTVAMVAIDRSEGEYGRAFIASVGDSRIYLVRRREMVRLNIDHTLGNEYVYAEQMSVNDAARLENADYPTRIVGINPEIQVDIGFYVERGNPFVNTRRAFEIGKRGMLLQEGDTLFVATKSLFMTSNASGNEVPLEDADFIDFAMDDDAQHAVRALLDMATRRNPSGNVTLAMTFVPSRFRRTVRVGARLGRRATILIAIGLLAFVGSLAVLALTIIQREQENRIVRQTQQRFEEIIAQASWTATFTRTPTFTPTASPTPTATLRPTAVAANQIGVQYFAAAEQGGEQEAIPVFPSRRVSSDDRISYLIITGLDSDNLEFDFNPAAIYLQPNNSLQFSLVRNTEGNASMFLQTAPDSDVFVRSADFTQGGVSVTLQSHSDISLFSTSNCFAAKQIPPNPNDPADTEKLAFTCFGGEGDVCSYTLAGGQRSEIPMGQRVLLDLDQSELILSEEAAYEEVKLYLDTVTTLTNADVVACLTPYLDVDGDGVPYPDDVCETQPGRIETNGCPDDDEDGIRNAQDDCPNEPGPIENGGCPILTATPVNLDPDGDGLIPPDDQCPTEFGPVENNGCPLESEDNPSAYGDA